MRLFLTALLALTAGAYFGASFFFYQQEEWARAPQKLDLEMAPSVRHPESSLGVVRQAIASRNFFNQLRPYFYRALTEAPASYQSSFLLAAFLANRLEAPERTERAFDAAIELSPSNGRLRLAYGQWLLTPKLGAPRLLDLSSPAGREPPDARRRGLEHLALAMKLEPELVPEALKLVAWSGLPSSAWRDLTPETVSARTELALVLARTGHRSEAIELLTETLEWASEREFFFFAARSAFQWNAPSVALNVGQKWLRQEERAGRAGMHFARAALVTARAYLELSQPEKAYETFSTALTRVQRYLGPSSSVTVELLRGMGYQYLNKNQTVMAESLLLKATEAAPLDPNSRLGLARVYRRSGNRRASIDSYREVLRLHPENAQADRELKELLLKTGPTGEGS